MSDDDRAPDSGEITERGEAELTDHAGEPPVVARMVVEIRSDDRRTIARGALDDVHAGQKVAVEAEGNTPLQLAFALARSLFKVPTIARSTARAVLPGKKRR